MKLIANMLTISLHRKWMCTFMDYSTDVWVEKIEQHIHINLNRYKVTENEFT